MIRYDRRAPEPLMEVLEGGWASSLAEYGGCGAFALDLQLRRNYDSPDRGWASLYVGLTKVLDLHYHPTKGFRLAVHDSHKEAGPWKLHWEAWFNGMTADQWREVESFIEVVIPAVGHAFIKEGAVQAAVTSFGRGSMAAIDREVVMSFDSVEERNATHAALQAPVLRALQGQPDGEDWWSAAPEKLGGELDLLAIDADGCLMAIEIKPAKGASGTIPWAPAQVRHYANLLREWGDHHSDAAEIVAGMVEQRRRLRLIRGAIPDCRSPIEIRPVVAIQRRPSDEVRRRLQVVRRRLEEAEVNDPALEVFEVNLIGRLDEYLGDA